MIFDNKKFTLSDFNEIYLMIPAQVSTGGPEAMHQLGNILRNDLNKKVKIYYVPTNLDDPIHANYKKFLLGFERYINDDAKNLLIIPEYYIYLIEAKKFTKIKKIIWWLSFDNYLTSKFKFENNKILRSIYKTPYNILKKFNEITNFFFGIYTEQDYLKFFYKLKNLNKFDEIKQASFHFVQSKYAYDHLEKKLNKIDYLSDFIREELTDNNIGNINRKRENIICYYPFKSNMFMNLILKKLKYKFVPLSNLNNNQIRETLLKSKIYIDIGSHPGKDRLPREAVMLGNCLITNKKGSAGNDIDIAIPGEFKFEERYSNIKKINDKINLILNDYSNEYLKFNSYKTKIINEKKIFKEEILKFFNKT
jgi:hypothetical protein